MPRYADVDKLLDYFDAKAFDALQLFDGGSARNAYLAALDAVAHGEIVDAVEVVRCRDCLNAMKMPESVREYFGYREDALDCGVGGGVMLPDDYCSKGCKMDAEV